MPSFQTLFQSNSPAVKRLLGWRQGDEDERWAEKAVDSLVKKLKKTPAALIELENILRNKSKDSQCITIPRSLDGRLQILHRKGLPHVIYCRVWRWPDLQSQHEIRAIESCEFSFNKSKSEVCINPYHYERIEISVPPPVLVPRKNELVANISDINMMNQQFNIQTLENNQENIPPMLYTTNQPPILNDNIFTNIFTPVPFVEVPNWCYISYFEMSNQYGEVFKASTQTIGIDGYANPDIKNGRFSLGAISNVRRLQSSEAVRNHIGQGLQIHNLAGDVYLENVSDCPVFIQSYNCNLIKGFNSKAVYRIPPGSSVQLFFANEFSKILNETIPAGYQAVNDMTKHCDVYISFIKGWGSGYPRQEVTACPCWLAIRLNTPLYWLDRVLFNIGAPNDPISSFT